MVVARCAWNGLKKEFLKIERESYLPQNTYQLALEYQSPRVYQFLRVNFYRLGIYVSRLPGSFAY
jgi:hypothetical protein